MPHYLRLFGIPPIFIKYSVATGAAAQTPTVQEILLSSSLANAFIQP
jgi:hypothetical protein